MRSEREEFEAEQRERAAFAQEALSEAQRVLPMARGWFAVAVMPDGNPAVMMHLPQYADAVCIQQLSVAVLKSYIADSFQTGATQQL